MDIFPSLLPLPSLLPSLPPSSSFLTNIFLINLCISHSHLPSPCYFFYFSRRVLQLAELARKMETQQEQILPYAVQPGVSVQLTQNNPSSQSNEVQPSNAIPEGGIPLRPLSLNKTIPPNNQTSVWSHIPTPNQVDGHHNIQSIPQSSHFITPEDRLWNFHRKYNQALLDCLAVDREKDRLERENAQLQDLITQFINGTRVSDEILASDNPLFVVNGR